MFSTGCFVTHFHHRLPPCNAELYQRSPSKLVLDSPDLFINNDWQVLTIRFKYIPLNCLTIWSVTSAFVIHSTHLVLLLSSRTLDTSMKRIVLHRKYKFTLFFFTKIFCGASCAKKLSGEMANFNKYICNYIVIMYELVN